MTQIKHIDYKSLDIAAKHIAKQIHENVDLRSPVKCYAIPRGGIPAAFLVNKYALINFVDTIKEADIFIDDMIDSGKTKEDYLKKKDIPFYALFEKTNKNLWLVFPWEKSNQEDVSITHNITRILQYIGENPKRGGLVETPLRVTKALDDWFSGYNKKPEDVLKVFEDGGEDYDQMIIVKDIPFYSHCEHHMAPFFGTITIGYIPDGKIVGLSKLSRLTDIYARRLQVQERFTQQVANAIMEHLGPIGVGVIVKARHLCMESRGICKQGHTTTTSSLLGVYRDQEVRAEFINLIK